MTVKALTTGPPRDASQFCAFHHVDPSPHVGTHAGHATGGAPQAPCRAAPEVRTQNVAAEACICTRNDGSRIADRAESCLRIARDRMPAREREVDSPHYVRALISTVIRSAHP